MRTKAKIFVGDAIEKMRALPAGSIDMVLCDMPFEMTSNHWDAMLDLGTVWTELKRICRRDTAICLFGSQPFTSVLVTSNLKAWKTEWIWRKNRASNFLTAKIRPLKRHESIQVFAFGNMPYYPQKTNGHKPQNRAVRRGNSSSNYNQHPDYTWEGGQTDRYPLSVLEFSSVIDPARIHPTQKPIELLRYLIRTHSKERDIVLDFTCGSGSTGIAALMENRHFIGIESDPSMAIKANLWLERAATAGPLFEGVENA